jgi:tryptophan synthase alpha chain
MNGLQRIASAFAAARGQNRAALMPYLTLGYPDPAQSMSVVKAVARAGADLIELGVPFSDPLADGPTIQRSTQVALEHGATTARCLEMAAALRQDGVSQPCLLMGYTNPLLAYGIERYCADAARAGADGLIVPDLPLEEAGHLEDTCRARGLALVYLAPPTSDAQRLRVLAAHSSGFLYLVSLTGVTGARRELPSELDGFVRRARAAAGSLPLAVGFGISTPEQAGAVGRIADGVIVGSALIDAMRNDGDPVSAAGDFVNALRRGLRP